MIGHRGGGVSWDRASRRSWCAKDVPTTHPPNVRLAFDVLQYHLVSDMMCYQRY